MKKAAQYLCATLITLVAGCAQEPRIGSLADGWNEFSPGGATSCSDGSPYRFYVRPGDTDKLMVYLQGGGACWFRQNCDPAIKPTYTINLDGRHPEQADGVFNFTRADNPLRNHTVVYAPYCSGDVHLGARDTNYPPVDGATGPLTVRHRGFANVQAVLDWTFANIKRPERIVVAGSSAGSIPSPYYATLVAQHYNDAYVVQLGDGSGGYRREVSNNFPYESWNTLAGLKRTPAFAHLDDDSFSYEALYVGAAAATPRVRFAAYDAAEDDVQKQFLALTGAQGISLLELIRLNQADIRAGTPGFRSFIAGGDSHTILGRDYFYTFKVGDRAFRDWFADLVNGAPVEDVACSQCEEAETTGATTAPRR